MRSNKFLQAEQATLCWDVPCGLIAGVDEAGRGPLAGPVVVVPYSYEQVVTETVKDAQDKEKKFTKLVKTQEYFYLIPKQLAVDSQLTSSIRYRGIYQVPIYSNQIKVKG